MKKNFINLYSDKALPDNFEQVGLIIDEYKNTKEKLDLVKSPGGHSSSFSVYWEKPGG